MRWRRVVVIASMAAVACTSSSTPAPSPPIDTSGIELPPPTRFLRTCDTSVVGTLGAGWRGDAVTVGTVSFVNLLLYADDPATAFQASPGRALPMKVLVVVQPGSEITVTVPAEYRDRLALSYDPARFNTRRLDAGTAEVTFRACPPASGGGPSRGTQFNGSFLVTSAGCVAIDVRADGSEVRVPVSFGGGGTCG